LTVSRILVGLKLFARKFHSSPTHAFHLMLPLPLFPQSQSISSAAAADVRPSIERSSLGSNAFVAPSLVGGWVLYPRLAGLFSRLHNCMICHRHSTHRVCVWSSRRAFTKPIGRAETRPASSLSFSQTPLLIHPSSASRYSTCKVIGTRMIENAGVSVDDYVAWTHGRQHVCIVFGSLY